MMHVMHAGCGLDGLRWNDTKNGRDGVNAVKAIVAEVFAEMEVAITIYQLK